MRNPPEADRNEAEGWAGSPPVLEWNGTIHPIAECFPMLSTEEQEKLKRDIEAHGLRHPVVLDRDGTLLDGRNRLKACEAAGKAPAFEVYAGDDPQAYILSANDYRRHMTQAERAIAAGKIANLGRGGDHGNQYVSGKPGLVSVTTGGKASPGGFATGSDTNHKSTGMTEAAAAEQLGVSRAHVQRAKTITRRGIPELAAMVERNEISLNAAEKVSGLPHEEQRQLVGEGPDAVKATYLQMRRGATGAKTGPGAAGSGKPFRRKRAGYTAPVNESLEIAKAAAAETDAKVRAALRDYRANGPPPVLPKEEQEARSRERRESAAAKDGEMLAQTHDPECLVIAIGSMLAALEESRRDCLLDRLEEMIHDCRWRSAHSASPCLAGDADTAVSGGDSGPSSLSPPAALETGQPRPDDPHDDAGGVSDHANGVHHVGGYRR